MPRYFYQAADPHKGKQTFCIAVEPQGDHMVSTCLAVDSSGRAAPQSEAIAPKFYGVTEEQALRRMVAALEASYEEVVPLDTGG